MLKRHALSSSGPIVLAALIATTLCACGPQRGASTNTANESAAQNSVATASKAAADNAPPGTSAAAQATPVGLGKITRAQADAAYTPEFGKCMNTGDAKDGVDPAMMDCLDAEFERQDARLNAAYKALLDRSDPKVREKIRADERAWLKKQKTVCDKPVDPPGGGSADRLNSAGCYIDTTIEQTAALNAR